MSIVTFASICGGVGTTTSAVTIAHAISRAGYETLLMDLHPSGNSGLCLGLDSAQSTYKWLSNKQPVTTYTVEARNCGLHMLRGGSGINSIEADYHMQHGTLAEIIVKIRDAAPMSFVVIDADANRILGKAAIAAADIIVIPFRCDIFGVRGLNATMAIAKKLNSEAQVSLLPTQFDQRLNGARYYLGEVQKQHGEIVAPPIPQRVAVSDAAAYGKTIWESNGDGLHEVRDAYSALVDSFQEELHKVRHGRGLWVYPQEMADMKSVLDAISKRYWQRQQTRDFQSSY